MSSYTAYAVSGWNGPEEIESYNSVSEAVWDILEIWPEDESEVTITDSGGKEVVYMARGVDPLVCHIYRGSKECESYHCSYFTNRHNRVECKVVLLG